MARHRENVRLGVAASRYIDRIKNEGHSEASLYTAHYTLARFQRAVATPRNPDPLLHLITVGDVDDYCYGPDGIRRGVAAVTFNRYRSVLKRFFDYALIMRWIDVSPMDAIQAARADMPKTRLMLNAGELLAMLEHCGNQVERIACAIGMNTGLRGNDVRHLTVFDASLASGTLQTEIRKTRKLDVKPISLELGRELRAWFDAYRELAGEELHDDWLLVPTYRVPLSKEQDRRIRLRPLAMHTHPWRLVQRPLERMGYPTKGEGFHTLRRSSARALFESLRTSGEGRDHALMIVKEYLNHASVMQTELYLGLNHDRVVRDTLLKDRPFLTAVAETEQERVTTTSLGRIAASGSAARM